MLLLEHLNQVQMFQFLSPMVCSCGISISLLQNVTHACPSLAVITQVRLGKQRLSRRGEKGGRCTSVFLKRHTEGQHTNEYIIGSRIRPPPRLPKCQLPPVMLVHCRDESRFFSRIEVAGKSLMSKRGCADFKQ